MTEQITITEDGNYGNYPSMPILPKPELAKPSIEDHAAHDYQLLLKEMHKQLDDFAGAKLKRVMLAIAEYPFEKQQVNFSYGEEKQLFATFSKLLDCKFVLMRAVLEMKKEEINKLWEEMENKKGKENVVSS